MSQSLRLGIIFIGIGLILLGRYVQNYQAPVEIVEEVAVPAIPAIPESFQSHQNPYNMKSPGIFQGMEWLRVRDTM
jgi:hypothetical protein